MEARCSAGEGAERNAAVEAEGTGLATDSPHVERDAAIHIDCCFLRDSSGWRWHRMIDGARGLEPRREAEQQGVQKVRDSDE